LAKVLFSNESTLSNYEIIVIEVTITQYLTTRLVIKKNDNVKNVIDEFCKANNLHAKKKGKLLEVANLQY